MTLADGFPAVSGTVDSTELRKNLAGLILRDTSGNPRAGVLPRHTNALVTSKASMAVDVAAFEGCAVRGGGPIFMSNDGTVSVTIDAAPGSNSRIDVVYFKQNESASPYSDANDNPIFGVEKGTAAPSPSKPTIPTGAVELATILIPAGVSATNAGGVVITQTFQYAALTGGELWVRNSTERGALGTYAAGVLVKQLDTQAVYRSTGAGFALWSMPRTSYTPATPTGVTLGTGGTVTGFMSISDGFATIEGTLTFGSGSPAATDFQIAVPTDVGTAQVVNAGTVRVQGLFLDASAGAAGRYTLAAPLVISASSIRLNILGTAGNITAITTVPGGAAIASGDIVHWILTFPVV